MCARCFRVLLMVLGVLLLGAAILPVFAVFHVPDEWATGVMASKLLMLPVGAICLLGATMLSERRR